MEVMERVETNLDVVFTSLRDHEKKKKGMVCEVIGAQGEYAVLMNRKYKKDNNLELSDLEKIIAEEAGSFVRMYIAEVFYDLKLNERDSIPFPESNITLKELNDMLIDLKKGPNIHLPLDPPLESEYTSFDYETGMKR